MARLIPSSSQNGENSHEEIYLQFAMRLPSSHLTRTLGAFLIMHSILALVLCLIRIAMNAYSTVSSLKYFLTEFERVADGGNERLVK